MKIALLQINPTVGDLAYNKELIARAAHRAGEADLAVTSELALIGYPPCDLLLNEEFRQSSRDALVDLAAELRDLPPILVGTAAPVSSQECPPLFDSAALLWGGVIKGEFRKTFCPACDLFDEGRYFKQAEEPQIMHINGMDLAIFIGEDICSNICGSNMCGSNCDSGICNRANNADTVANHVADLVAGGARAVVNLSASPFTVGKHQHRQALLADLARKHRIPVLFVNQVGGNDEVVFDGRSCFFDSSGRLAGRAKGFEEDVIVADLDDIRASKGSISGTNSKVCSGSTGKRAIAEDDFNPEAEIWGALVLGTHDYVHKSGFSSAVLGLSGGIDSSLVAAIAAHALGQENVLCVIMPSPYTSQRSIDDAVAQAENLNLKTITISITDIMMAFESGLAEHFIGLPEDATEENIQARIRSTLLMALANKYRSILLATGNRSELAVGYCTIYGDMAGGLAPISDLLKTTVYQLAGWINSNAKKPIIPESILKKAPTAELRPGQTDEDSLPPYALLDSILKEYIDGHKSRKELLAAGYDQNTVDLVIYLVKNAEFKRFQAAPSLKVIDRFYGHGWKMPVACRPSYAWKCFEAVGNKQDPRRVDRD